MKHQTDLIIQHATEKDLTDISKLSYELFEYHDRLVPNFFAGRDKNTSEHYYYDFKNKIKDKDKAIFLVAIKNQEIIGYLVALVLDKPWQKITPVCSLDEISVHETHQNQGVGEALFNALKKECKKRKLKLITLNVYANNKRAIKFYQRLGCQLRSQRMDIKVK